VIRLRIDHQRSFSKFDPRPKSGRTEKKECKKWYRFEHTVCTGFKIAAGCHWHFTALGLKKIPVVPVPDRPYFFLPTLLFFQRDWPCDPIFSGWLQAAHTACRNGVCCHTNYWTKLPKFVHRKYASLVNIDVGTLLQIAQQKTAKTMKKIFQKNLFPTYRP
jgi:hypothetical protein